MSCMLVQKAHARVCVHVCVCCMGAHELACVHCSKSPQNKRTHYWFRNRVEEIRRLNIEWVGGGAKSQEGCVCFYRWVGFCRMGIGEDERAYASTRLTIARASCVQERRVSHVSTHTPKDNTHVIHTWVCDAHTPQHNAHVLCDAYVISHVDSILSTQFFFNLRVFINE